LEILRAIDHMEENQLNRYYFIFAGKMVSKSVEIIQLISKYKNHPSCCFINRFILDEELNWLCQNVDLFLLPYKRDCQSSGCIGYAAEFNKPVIVSKDGFLGKLVLRNKLGYRIGNSNSITICNFLTSLTRIKRINGQSYLSNLTVENFRRVIYTQFSNGL
jgi:hypothetical protein